MVARRRRRKQRPGCQCPCFPLCLKTCCHAAFQWAASKQLFAFSLNKECAISTERPMGTIQLFNHPIKMVYLLLIVAEGALLLAAVHLGVYLRFVHQPAAMTEFSALGAKAALFAGVVMLAMVSVGLYNRRLRDGMGRVLLRLGLAL